MTVGIGEYLLSEGIRKEFIFVIGIPIPEALDKCTIIIGGIKSGEVIQAVYSAVEMCRAMDNKNILPVDYQDTNISMKIVKIIQSYTKIINKNVWQKN